MRGHQSLVHLVRIGSALWVDLWRFIQACLRARTALAAENLFLRKQLALYHELVARPRRANDSTRVTLVPLARCFAWKQALLIVQPATLIRWHRQGFRLFWRWRSTPRGRARVPADLRRLIRAMAQDNPTWGEERIAAELLLKLGLRVSPRTVRRYMLRGTGGGNRPSSQRWRMFVRNHAHAMLACDCCVAVTARFCVLDVFVVMQIGSRRLVHVNVTGHPTTAWPLQQFREVLAEAHAYRFLLHDRGATFSHRLDDAFKAMGVRAIRTPFQAPPANACCERVIGTMQRECLDVLIPLSEEHLRRILQEWANHYNRGRPHASLGPGLPDPPADLPALPNPGHRLPEHSRVAARPILGRLHHEYGLEKVAA